TRPPFLGVPAQSRRYPRKTNCGWLQFVESAPPRGGADSTTCGQPRFARGSEPEIAADELLHDLVRARPDLVDPGVLPGPGDAVLVHEAVAAVQLDALVEDLALDLRGPPLRLRGVDGRELPLRVRHDA